MKDNLKNIILIASFAIVIMGMLIINIIKEDTQISLSERRELKQFPEYSFSRLVDGSFLGDFDKYVTDQIIYREGFRKVKVLTEKNVFRKLDYNNIYERDGILINQLYPLNEKSVLNLTSKLNGINENYLTSENKIYFTIVPDKNYFVSGENLRLDYEKMTNLMKENLKFAEYIDIFNELELSDYYITDSHWKQEKIIDVAKKILNKMGLETNEKYNEKEIITFKGVYAGQYPIETESDKITVLTNNMLEKCTVYDVNTKKETKIYDMNKLNSKDKYDIYLSGPTTILNIDNPSCKTNKELIIFRDSYGSSLTPLLVEGYKKVTVVDTRYISSKLLGDYIEFKNQDVLFEYSTTLINDSVTVR